MDTFAKELIQSKYKDKPVKISITYTTSDRLNGYGYAIAKEVSIYTIERICIHCKVIDADKKQKFCPVHGWHKMGYGWTEENNNIEQLTT